MTYEKITAPQQDMPYLQPPFYMAKKMGARLAQR